MVNRFPRRQFLSLSAAGLAPLLGVAETQNSAYETPFLPKTPLVKFFGDGEMFEPEEYLTELSQFINGKSGMRDRYGSGGAVEALEKKFSIITGKEKAIFLPTGTMANQIAIALLSGDKTKVFVQETSHVYRDEADAAQSVFGKRLMPLAPGQTYFTAAQLQSQIEQVPRDEVFQSGIGAVSIENPVRRMDGRQIPLEELEKISAFCRSRQIGLHLDGARIYMACAWSGHTVKDYAAHFDTVYISLYKYLGAAAGAMLCGPSALIEKIPHLLKIHGGSMYGNWANAAMALHRLEGLESRLSEARRRWETISSELQKTPGFSVKPLDGGTNIYLLQIPQNADGKRFREQLRNAHGIAVGQVNAAQELMVAINETLCYKSESELLNAFRSSV